MREPSTAKCGRFTAGYGRFVIEILRGKGQVVFLRSAWAGAAASLALCAAGWEFALYGLLGTAVGTATARILGVDRDRVTAGLEGFNACLVAVALAVFLGADHLSTAVLACAGSVVVTVVTGAVARILATWGLPTLTLPYCLMASAATIAAPGFERVWHHGASLAALARPASGPTALAGSDLWRAFFANIAQVFFMPQWYVGLVLLLGIFAACRLAGVMACLGSGVGILTAWALGAPAKQVAEGTMGYNAVLVAMALCGVFLAADAWSLAYALAGAVTATGLSATMAAVFAPSGGHTFTWPFVLVSLAFLAAVPAFPRLRRAGAPDPGPGVRDAGPAPERAAEPGGPAPEGPEPGRAAV
ncbi:urea transporter [Streptomyces sp. NPDC017993]|uniref:urea transporter n=1 Tax=Streptomyces sp. NPDC017993 TaxID=3365027 RepID=UPI0037B61D62